MTTISSSSMINDMIKYATDQSINSAKEAMKNSMDKAHEKHMKNMMDRATAPREPDNKVTIRKRFDFTEAGLIENRPGWNEALKKNVKTTQSS